MNIFYANAGSHLSPSVSGAQIRAGAQHPSDYADAHVCPASSVRVMTKPWNLFWGLNHRTEEGEDTQAPWNINSGRKPPRDPGTDVPRESVTRETSCANAPTSWPMHRGCSLAGRTYPNIFSKRALLLPRMLTIFPRSGYVVVVLKAMK